MESGAESSREGDLPPPVSELLPAVLERAGEERVSLGEVTDPMSGRAHGLLLFVLALPEAVPMVGLSLVLAIPIFVIGAHLVARGSDVAIPDWISRRSIKRSHLEKAFEKALPAVRWLERVSRPRWPALAGAARLQGAICVLMAVVLAVPFPGINILAAFAVAGVGLGMLQQDGMIVAASLLSALLAAAGIVAVVTGAVALAG